MVTADDHSFVAAALSYARRRWPVFPCHPTTKQPLVGGVNGPSGGRKLRGTGGLKRATTDEDLIQKWWAQWPNASVGVPTGHLLGAFVVDIDAGTDPATGRVFTAEEIQTALENEIGSALPATWQSATPRGGRHIFFRPTIGSDMPGNRAGVIPRIDVRGEGGYVIVPPSVRPDGKRYAWRAAPDAIDLATAPEALMDLVTRRGKWATKQTARPSEGTMHFAGGGRVRNQRRYAIAVVDDEISKLRAAPDGKRNDSLFRAAINLAQLVASGAIDQATARGALESVARGWPNLAKSLGTIESGFSRGLAEPRTSDFVSISRETMRVDRGPAQHFEIKRNGYEDVGAEEQRQLDAELAGFPMTDLGNAERFARRLNGRLLWCAKLSWLNWDGKRWTRNGSDACVKRAEHEVARSIQTEAEWLRSSGNDFVDSVRFKGTRSEETTLRSDRLAAWGRTSENARHLAAIAKRGQAMMSVDPGAFDADPFKINVLNGTLVVCQNK